MPKVVDRIRKYINNGRNSGQLRPGDKLPPYRELTGMFKGSIQTIRTALTKLEKDGLVETVNGVGCFVGGKKPLSVAVIGFPATTIETEKFQKLFDDYLAKSHLHIKVKVFSHEDDSSNGFDDYQAVISIRKKILKKTLCDFSEFADYGSVVEELCDFPYMTSRFSIPFFYITHHFGIHKKTLEITGMKAQEFTSDFKWWSKYAALCRKHNITAASALWPEEELYMFRTFFNLFFSLKINYTAPQKMNSGFFQKPMFNNAAGEKLLQIVDDCVFASENLPFLQDGVGINLKLGSWINVPNPNRENVIPEKLQIIPYKCGDRKILAVSPKCLSLYLDQDVNKGEKERLWELMKTMFSRDFQKEFCALSGVISVRKDFSREDYFWSENENMAEVFLPAPNDIIIYEHIFSVERAALLTTAIELYKQKSISANEALILMDKKLKMEVPK